MLALRQCVAAALCLSSSACTSLSWTDSSGDRHHLGLVLVRQTESDSHSVIDRWSLGADLRVDGDEAGWTLGLARRRHVDVPVRTAPADEVCREYVRFIEGCDESPPVETTRWRVLYFHEPCSARAQIEHSWSTGVDVAWGMEPRGLVVPFGSWSRIHPSALGDDAVLAARGCADRVEMRCWKLASHIGDRAQSDSSRSPDK
ncbi:MAG: hypothetical protein ACKVWV_14730 [Planctomycetota bacterium]